MLYGETTREARGRWSFVFSLGEIAFELWGARDSEPILMLVSPCCGARFRESDDDWNKKTRNDPWYGEKTPTFPVCTACGKVFVDMSEAWGDHVPLSDCPSFVELFLPDNGIAARKLEALNVWEDLQIIAEEEAAIYLVANHPSGG